MLVIQQTCPELGKTDGFSTPSDNLGRQGSEFSGRSLLPRNRPVLVSFLYAIIMSANDSALITDLLAMFKRG